MFEVFFQLQKLEEFDFSIYKQQMSFERENLWKYDSEFDNTLLLNEHSTTALFQPLVQYEEIKPVESDDRVNFMSAFAGGKQCVNSLRLLSTEQAVTEKNQSTGDVLYFCTHEKNERTGERRFTLLPYYQLERKGERSMISLQEPKWALIINNKLLVAVEKKCVSLYSIQGSHIMVKDFDAIGIGNRLVLVDAQHLVYKNRDFILFFGNEKDNAKPFFKCLVYQIIGSKLKFIKKAVILAGEIYRPLILFDNYPGIGFEEEKFCLILGGFEDYELQNYKFGGLQVHLHLLIEQWIEYSTKLTLQLSFRQKHTITSGKALKVTTNMVSDECWLIFCTEYQTVSKMYMKFGQNGPEQFEIQDFQISTRRINVKDERTGQAEPIFYSCNTVYLMKAPDEEHQPDKQIPYRIYWCDKGLERIRSRPLRDYLTIF